MTPEMIGAYMGILVPLAGLLAFLMKLSFNQGQLKFQVDQLWKVIFANAQVELVSRGLAQVSSPLHIVSEGYDFIAPYLPQYLPIYQRVEQRMKNLPNGEIERRLFQTFQQEAGESIFQQICLPRGLTLGAGIMAVIQACQESLRGGIYQSSKEIQHGDESARTHRDQGPVDLGTRPY